MFSTHTPTHTVTCEVTEMWISVIMVIIYRYVCMSHHQTVHFEYKQLEKEGLTCPETGALLYIRGDPGSERGSMLGDEAREVGWRWGAGEVGTLPSSLLADLWRTRASLKVLSWVWRQGKHRDGEQAFKKLDFWHCHNIQTCDPCWFMIH